MQQERDQTIDRNPTRINEQIRISPIRVIADDGTQLGIIATEEALEKARGLSLDLVEVAPTEEPPVCRIMDYGKYKYDRKKKTAQSTHNVKLKEIRLRPKTDTHDIDFKMKRAKQFLKQKDKVQVSVIFKGREMAHLQEGRKVMERAIEELTEHGKVESAPTQLGRRIVCTISPK
ncbi:MAG: translation initiation factor IF-3 [Pirellulaceae bacterium]